MDEWFCKIVCLHKKEKQKILSVVDCGVEYRSGHNEDYKTYLLLLR